jgi:hypothetical protein
LSIAKELHKQKLQLLNIVLAIMFVILLQLSSSTTSALEQFELCTIPYTPPENYTKLQSEIEVKIKDFSNLLAFAKQADDMLSKLISAKSPVITSWLNKRDLKTKSEEEVIKEWRKYFALNFIIAKYPYKQSDFDIPIEFLFNGISTGNEVESHLQ